MHIDFTFKNFDPSEHLKKYARRRFEKIGRFLGKSPSLLVQIVLSVDKIRQIVEVKVTGDGLDIHTSEQSSDMYASLDLASDKVESQIRKFANKEHSHHRKTRSNANVDIYSYELQEDNGTQVVSGTENFAPKPLHMDEAILQLQNDDNEVLVFINAELERINVLYRKKNGDFGIIDPIV